jgi:hypothetical protein
VSAPSSPRISVTDGWSYTISPVDRVPLFPPEEVPPLNFADGPEDPTPSVRSEDVAAEAVRRRTRRAA